MEHKATTKIKIKNNATQINKVKLNELSVDKLNVHLEQINQTEGLNISRSDLVNWIISKQPLNLSVSDLNEIKERFFDPVKALEILTKELKLAKTAGNNFDIKRAIEEKFFTKKTKKTLKNKMKTIEKKEVKCYDI